MISHDNSPQLKEIPLLSPAHALAWSEDMTERHDSGVSISLWRPAGLTLALGLSQRAETELNMQAVAVDRVAVIRRHSGGGAVLLGPGVLCWESIADNKALADFSGLRQAYEFLTQPVRLALAELGIKAVSAGISDLSVINGNKRQKIAGTAQLRKKNNILVHGSLLVDIDIGIFEKYLAFPSEVPDYRDNRKHDEFCITVQDIMHKKHDNTIGILADNIISSALSIGWDVLPVPLELTPRQSYLCKEKYENYNWNIKRQRDWQKIK